MSVDLPDPVEQPPDFIWDDDGLHAPDIDNTIHLKTVDRFKRTANGDPQIIFSDGSTLNLYAEIVRGSTYVPLTVLYRAKGGRKAASGKQPASRSDGNVQRDRPAPTGYKRVPTPISKSSRPKPHAGSTTQTKRPSRNKG